MAKGKGGGVVVDITPPLLPTTTFIDAKLGPLDKK